VNCKRTDGDNLVKILTDCIVQKGLIEDDRKIMRYVIEKYAAKEDRIEVEISEWFSDVKVGLTD
jgi:Holliday junction resolvase RusA-like endonuclease